MVTKSRYGIKMTIIFDAVVINSVLSAYPGINSFIICSGKIVVKISITAIIKDTAIIRLVI